MIVYLDNKLVKIANYNTLLSSGSKGLFVALSGGTAGQWIALAQPGSIIDLGIDIIGKILLLTVSGNMSNDSTSLTEDAYTTFLGYTNSEANFVFRPIAPSTIFVA